jgi:hypothetical protein
MAEYKEKIHLAKSFDSLEVACSTPKTFNGRMVTNYFYKVNCTHCLRIVESMKRAGKLSLTETMKQNENRNN